MLKLLKGKQAQAVVGEYLLVFFLVVGMLTAMSIYFKRAVQARVFGARKTMRNIVIQRADGFYTEDLEDVIRRGYEPYYAETNSTVWRRSDTRTDLTAGGTTGIFSKTIDESTTAITRSETAPPKSAD